MKKYKVDEKTIFSTLLKQFFCLVDENYLFINFIFFSSNIKKSHPTTYDVVLLGELMGVEYTRMQFI